MPRARRVGDDAVLDAVGQVIGERGVAGLTLAQVGERAGLSAATLVQRFGSKRELLLAFAERTGEAVPHAFEGGDVVAGLVRLAGSVHTPERLAHSLSFLQLDLTDPDFHVLAERFERAMLDEIERAVGDPERARTVLTTYNGALITWALLREGSLDDWMRARLGEVL